MYFDAISKCELQCYVMKKVMFLFLLKLVSNIAPIACMDLEFLASIDFPSTEKLDEDPLAAILRTVFGSFYQAVTKVSNEKKDTITYIFKNLDRVIHNVDEEDLKVVVGVIEKEIELYNLENKNNTSTELLKHYVKKQLREMAKNGAFKIKLTDLIEKKKSNTEFFSLLSELFSTEDLAHMNTYIKSFNVYSRYKNRAMQEKTVTDAVKFSSFVYGKMDDKSKGRINAFVHAFIMSGK